jgi:hypothetical protein
LIPKLSKINASRSEIARQVALSDPVASVHNQYAWLAIGLKPHEPEERVDIIPGTEAHALKRRLD